VILNRLRRMIASQVVKVYFSFSEMLRVLTTYFDRKPIKMYKIFC